MKTQPQDEWLVTIEAGHGEFLYWRDLWAYRELFFFLAWRDILVRYKQTVVGILWAIIRPLLTMLVFTIVFGNLANMPSGGHPYPLLVIAGMVPWSFFSNALSESGNCLIANSNLLTKVYFPRILIPGSTILVCFVDFLISLIVLFVLQIGYAVPFLYTLLAIPFFTGLIMLAAFGCGLWLAALNVKYRDFRYVIPFLIQFGMYISPVGFLTSVIPGKWQAVYALNPMVGIIDGFRWAIFGGPFPYLPALGISILVSLSLCVSGFWYFRKVERSFADII